MLSGIYPALFTPFDDELNVDFDAMASIIDFQLESGVDGFFVTGSTGEGLLLSTDERLAVIRFVAAHCKGKAKTIAHVGHPSTQTSELLAIKSAAAGVDWIASVTPIYHGTTFDGTLRHYRQIATATELPFMVYCLGTEIVPERDVKIFELPNVHGLKYTGANYFSVQQLARQLDRPIALLNLCDEQIVASLSFGFHGGIGSTYNFAPSHYVNIREAFLNSDIDEASRLQAEINMVTDLMIKYENWSYRKAIMRYIGLDCGPCRPPYAPLSESEYETFAGQLDSIGVLKRNDKE